MLKHFKDKCANMEEGRVVVLLLLLLKKKLEEQKSLPHFFGACQIVVIALQK